MSKAISKAVGKNKPKLGGVLAVKYTKDGTPQNPKHNPPKEFKVIYTPPGGASTTDPATGLPANAEPHPPKPAAAPHRLAAVAWAEFKQKVTQSTDVAGRWKAMLAQLYPQRIHTTFGDLEWNCILETIRLVLQPNGAISAQAAQTDDIPY